MIHGFVIFHEGTGSLLCQRRFIRGFGLQGAAQQPSLVDPVGLALQLYAFNKFCSGIKCNSRLEGVTLGPPTIGSNTTGLARLVQGITFAAASLPSSAEGRELPLVLALFGDLPTGLGQHFASRLLASFVTEHVAAQQGVGRGPGVPPRAGGHSWRFLTLHDFLQNEAPDLFAAAVADRLPSQPRWLMVIAATSATVSAVQKGIPVLTTPISVSPRPPAEPAPDGRGRAPLARRMLQRLPGGCFSARGGAHSPERPGAKFDAVVMPATENGTKLNNKQSPQRPASAPPTSSTAARQFCDGDNQALGQAKVSWWQRMRSPRGSPRGRQVHPAGTAVVEPAMSAFTAQAPSAPSETRCYFYTVEGDERFGTDGLIPGRIAQRVDLERLNVSTTGSAVKILSVTHCENEAADDCEFAAAFVLSHSIAVAIPATALETVPSRGSGDGSSQGVAEVDYKELARSWRRSADGELSALRTYLSFMENATAPRSSSGT